MVLPSTDHDWVISEDFQDLLYQLLVKDPHRRITWDKLLEHPFWNGCLPLAKIKMPQQELFDAKAPATSRYGHNTALSNSWSVVLTLYFYSSQINVVEKEENREVEENQEITSTINENLSTAQRASRDDAPEVQSGKAAVSDTKSFALDGAIELKTRASLTVASRPISAPAVQSRHINSHQHSSSAPIASYSKTGTSDEREGRSSPEGAVQHRKKENNQLIYPPQAPATAPPAGPQKHSPSRSKLLEIAMNRGGGAGGGLKKLSKLLLTTGDCPVQPIVWNNSIEKLILPQARPELLPFAPMTPNQLASSDTEILEQHLKDIYIHLKRIDTDPLEQQAIMVHLFECCNQSKLANVIVNSSIFSLLIKLLTVEANKSPSESPTQILAMICLIIGVLFRFATFFAPSTSDPLRPLVQTLRRVINQGAASSENGCVSQSRLDPHRLAMACLGEMLFYLSSQTNPGDIVTTALAIVIAGMNSQDLILRHYSTRALCNTLANCRDESVLANLAREEVVIALLRSIVELSDSESSSPIFLSLLTTTTQALVQIIRYARSLTTRAGVPVTDVLLLFAKRNVMRAVWSGFRRGLRDSNLSLSIASLNVLNLFLETKLRGGRRDGMKAIEVSRSDVLERVISFSDISAALKPTPKLDRNNQDASEGSEETNDEESYPSETEKRNSVEDAASLLRAKVMLLLYIGIQASREFVDKCLESQVINLVEQIFAPLVAAIEKSQLLDDPNSSISSSTRTVSTSSKSEPQDSPTNMLLSANSYQLQCVLNLIKVSIRTSLKLGAECISSSEHSSESVVVIAATPFKLLDALLINPTCRAQLVQHFASNDNKQFTFFLRLMTKLLTVFPNEHIDGNPDMAIIGAALTDILLRLFQCAATDAPELVLVEPEVLYMNLLVALVETITDESTSSDTSDLAVTSVRVIYLILLQFEPRDEDGCDHRNKFIRTCLLPRLCDLLICQHKNDESVWRFSIELLFGVVSNDQSLLDDNEAQMLIPVILQLLVVPRRRGYHAIPSSATKLAKMVVMRSSQSANEAGLYEAGIVRSLLDALAFAVAEALTVCLLDLLEILLQLLHDRYETIRKAGSSSRACEPPPQFESFRDCGPLLTQLCAASKHLLVNEHPNEYALDDESQDLSETRQESQIEEHSNAIADLASRCLIFSSQVLLLRCWGLIECLVKLTACLVQLFGDKLNDVLFSNCDQRTSVARCECLTIE